MSKKMLIDATHIEETRVAIVDDGRLEEFDYESSFRKPLKGNIYLAKVTRVEPSLQAAFVNFGGNRHGFLPFSEIHPDYFRIPVADRKALIAEQEAALQAHDEEEALDDHDEPEDEVSLESDEDDVEEDAVEELGGDLAVASEEDDEEAKAAQKPARGRKSKDKDSEADGADMADEKADVDVVYDEDLIGNRKEELENDIDGNVVDDEEEEANGNSRNRRGGRGRGRRGGAITDGMAGVAEMRRTVPNGLKLLVARKWMKSNVSVLICAASTRFRK